MFLNNYFNLLILSLFSSISVQIVHSLNIFDYLTIPAHDGKNRVNTVNIDTEEQLNDRLLNKFVNLNLLDQFILTSVNCVSGDHQPTGDGQHNDHLLQIIGQIFEYRNLSIYDIHIRENSFIVDAKVQCNQIIIYLNGKKHVYYGLRRPLPLIRYLLKLIKNVNNTLSTSCVKQINGKLDKKVYDSVHETKVIGYFLPNTPEYNEYLNSIDALSSSVKFFLVTERNVAKHLRLERIGQINLVKPMEKYPITLNKYTANSTEIIDFINTNLNDGHLIYLNEENVYDPYVFNVNDSQRKNVFLAIGDRSSTLGNYFHRLIVKLVKNESNVYHKHNQTKINKHEQHLSDKQKINVNANTDESKNDLNNAIKLTRRKKIVWIDVHTFPSVSLMLEKHFAIDHNQLMQFGYVDVMNVVDEHISNGIDTMNIWFNMSTLNLVDGGNKSVDELNLLTLKNFIHSINESEIDTSQRFINYSNDLVINEGDNFVLTCEIANQIGDCMWLRNGQYIGFNLDRYKSHYQWSNGEKIKTINDGDCNLHVNGALRGQDDGQWQCEITGDQNNRKIQSPSINVNIVNVKRNEL